MGWMTGSVSDRGREGIFSSLPHPDQFWGPPTFYPAGTRGSFPGGQSSQGVRLATWLHLVLRLRIRMCGAVCPLPNILHGI